MSINYKIDILEALKEKGYTAYKLRQDKLLSEGVIQSIREGKMISMSNVDKICTLLNCEVGDILVHVKEN